MSPDIDPVDEAAQDGPDAELLSAETQADPILGLSEETRRFDLRELFQGAVKACLELVLEEEQVPEVQIVEETLVASVVQAVVKSVFVLSLIKRSSVFVV